MVHHPLLSSRHIVCADLDVIYLKNSLTDVEEVLQYEGWLRMNPATYVVVNPIPSIVPDTLQDRITEFEDNIARIACYVKLRGDEAVTRWYKRFRQEARGIRTRFNKVKEDVLLLHRSFLLALGYDCASNTEFNTKYGPLFYKAMLTLEEDLAPSFLASELQRFRSNTRYDAYKMMPVTERIIPDAASLSVDYLAYRVHTACSIILQRWYHLHGVSELPGTVKAIEMLMCNLFNMTQQ